MFATLWRHTEACLEHTSDFVFATLWRHTEACLSNCVLTEPHHGVTHVYGHTPQSAPCLVPFETSIPAWTLRTKLLHYFCFCRIHLCEAGHEDVTHLPCLGFCNLIAVVIAAYVPYGWSVFSFYNKSIYIECSHSIASVSCLLLNGV